MSPLVSNMLTNIVIDIADIAAVFTFPERWKAIVITRPSDKWSYGERSLEGFSLISVCASPLRSIEYFLGALVGMILLVVDLIEFFWDVLVRLEMILRVVDLIELFWNVLVRIDLLALEWGSWPSGKFVDVFSDVISLSVSSMKLTKSSIVLYRLSIDTFECRSSAISSIKCIDL